MKKKYLFTLAAGLICTLTAYAQETALPDSVVSINWQRVNNSKTIFHYNDKQQNDQSEFYTWNADESQWELSHTTTYEYDDQGRMTLEEYRTENKHYLQTREYGEQTCTRIIADTTWRNEEKTSYSYSLQRYEEELNEAGLTVKATNYSFYGGEDQLEGIHEYTYNEDGKMTSWIFTDYLKGEVYAKNTQIWSYDGDNAYMTSTYESGNPEIDANNSYEWKTETKGDNPRITTNYYKDASMAEWDYNGEEIYYYSSSTPDANTQIRPESTIKVYGTDGAIRIELAKAALVEVYSISGQRLYAQVVDGTINIPVATGIYIVRAANEVTKVSIRK